MSTTLQVVAPGRSPGSENFSSSPRSLRHNSPWRRRARSTLLVYGPYISLPPGSWSASVILGFSPEAANMSYAIEVFAGNQLTHARIEPGDERIFEANLHFSIDAAVDHPLQIRIHNERPAFDGRLAVGYVTMTPQASVHGDAQAHLKRG